MEKINFANGQAPALNGANLNQLQANVENAINDVENKVDEIVKGTLTGLNGVTVDYGSYMVYGKILILVASLTATQTVARYDGIAQLSNGAKGLIGNAYIYPENNHTCYLNKNSGRIDIYQSGGFPAGSSLTWVGVYALSS